MHLGRVCTEAASASSQLCKSVACTPPRLASSAMIGGSQINPSRTSGILLPEEQKELLYSSASRSFSRPRDQGLFLPPFAPPRLGIIGLEEREERGERRAENRGAPKHLKAGGRAIACGMRKSRRRGWGAEEAASLERRLIQADPPARMAAAAATATTSPPPGTALPPFQFRPRHEGPNWRRLSAVEVDRVAAEVNVAVLQEHLEHVTFCNAGRERCPHCQGPADPLLLKLLRLAQLCLEYLLHSQDYLSAQLRAGQELLRAADAHRDLLAKDVARGAQQIRLLKEECKRRKKMIATQQMMLQAGATYHQCQFCDKAFMNSSFLHSHLQRRHSEEPVTDQKKKSQTYKLQEEINQLKEQLQLTRSQLEAEQHAHIVKLSKEYEDRRSKEEEIRHLFHKWKEEEKEKLARELEKVKEMFMKEFKELTAKNSELENHLLEVQKSNQHLKSNLGTLKDTVELTDEKHRIATDHQNVMQLLEKQEAKWSSKVQALQEEHENEKYQLTTQIEKLKASVAEELNMSNIFYEKRLEEVGQKLQEQNDLIIIQKHQIEKLASKKPVENSKLSEVKTSAQNVQPKSSPSSMHDFGIEAENQSVLPAVRLLSKERPESAVQEIEKQVPQTGKNKSHINILKSDPSLTKELRTVLEQTLAEKLESLGIKSGVRGIPSDHLNRVLISVETAREERKKQLPDIQHIREQLERQVSFRVAERSSCSRFLSNPLLSSEAKYRTTRLGTSLPTVFPKPVKRSSITKHSLVQRTLPAENTSTPKTKKNMLKDEISRKPPSTVTPPFSSEEEVEDNDIRHSYISPELSLHKASKSHNKDNLTRFAYRSDVNIPEDEVDLKPSRSRSSLLQNEMDEMEKFLLSQRKESKEIGGMNGGSSSIHTCAQGVKFTGIGEEDDWDLSSLEDEKPLKDEKNKNVRAVEKNDPCAVSMTHEWGKPVKDEGRPDADMSSSPKSSLVTVTDWSDSSDI
ncbi:cilium assembly protein DZIP1 isoform X2 [Pantherophis guttatus]|uniref:Cilium assembly protein DZIP1 isoform X2 n=1 Tax=Pantherophis guttatus TaxID=94885 RepID=A0A6P9C198_PANGU|nr:cilium assembly protein DZIP1 isoform X2 [Pantherophis guttatus]